jgi:hypothetical protein
LKREIPEIFIPKRRPKPKRRAAARPRSLAAAIAEDAVRDRELAAIDRLMRSNACPFL